MLEFATPMKKKDFRVLACASGSVLLGPFVGPMRVKELRRNVLETHSTERTLKFSPFADCRCELLDNHRVPPHHDVYVSYGDLVEPTEKLWKRDVALYWLRKGFACVDSESEDMAHPDLQEELENVAGTSNEFRVSGLSAEVPFGPFKGPIRVKTLRQLLQAAEPTERMRTILACSQRGLVMLDDHWIPMLHDVHLILRDFAMPSSELWQREEQASVVIKFSNASETQQMMIVDAVVGALSEDRQRVFVYGRHKAAEETFQKRMSEPGFCFAFRRKESGESEVQGYADADTKMKFVLSGLPTWVAFVFKGASPDALV